MSFPGLYKVVFDLYSGTGTIGQIVARKAKAVYGIEIVEEAVESANKSAKENGLTNCTFIAGDVLEEIEKRKEMVDVIIVDPPRDGINQKALKKNNLLLCKKKWSTSLAIQKHKKETYKF